MFLAAYPTVARLAVVLILGLDHRYSKAIGSGSTVVEALDIANKEDAKWSIIDDMAPVSFKTFMIFINASPLTIL